MFPNLNRISAQNQIIQNQNQNQNQNPNRFSGRRSVERRVPQQQFIMPKRKTNKNKNNVNDLPPLPNPPIIDQNPLIIQDPNRN